MSETVVAGVRLTNPDKVLYPEQGITKGQLADYYSLVGERMLPHLAGRPATMVRCPTGQEKKCFYQRHAGSGVLPQLKEIAVPGFDEPYLYIEDVPGLVAMVQMGVLEIHPWGVRIDRPTEPDRLIFDLDPAEGLGFGEVVKAALEVRDGLAKIGLQSFARTTGGKGLHVVVPIERGPEWKEVKSFAKSFSEKMAAEAPDRYLTRISKAERSGRIFIDYLRNDPTSTAVGSYSTRARPGAPVATPLFWEEVVPTLDPAGFNLVTVPERIAGQRSDPWEELLNLSQPLPQMTKPSPS